MHIMYNVLLHCHSSKAKQEEQKTKQQYNTLPYWVWIHYANMCNIPLLWSEISWGEEQDL